MTAVAVDFKNVSTEGLVSSPHAEALAGLRANEARYFHTKFGRVFEVVPAQEAPEVLAWVERILSEERGIVVASRPLEISVNDVVDRGKDGAGPGSAIHWVHVIYESGLVLNVLWSVEDGGKRAVGFKLCEGMDVPEELSAFKFARQRSKLAGTIRGSFFVIKGDYSY